MDMQDEQTLAEDIVSTTVTCWEHNVVQKNAWHEVQKTIKAHCASPLRTGHLLLA
ncbi:hypothetical protein [Candidatus Bartonella washoeensis]|nr:hypothetical protein [Bartonella washoeensis]